MGIKKATHFWVAYISILCLIMDKAKLLGIRVTKKWCTASLPVSVTVNCVKVLSG